MRRTHLAGVGTRIETKRTMSEEVFLERLRDLVADFVHTNKTVDQVMWGDTIEVDGSHAVDIELSLTRYNND